MNNGDKKPSGNRPSGFDPKMFDIANSRREQVKRAEEARQRAEEARLRAEAEERARAEERAKAERDRRQVKKTEPAKPLPKKREPAPPKETSPEKEAQKAANKELKAKKKQLRRKKWERFKELYKEKKKERSEKISDKSSDTEEKEQSRFSKLREKYKGTLKDALAYFVIFLCILLIICTGAATIFLWNVLNYGEKPETPSKIIFTTEGKDKIYTYDEIVRGGVYYVNFTSIAKLCDLSLGGDGNVFVYSTASGEQIRFTPPSRTVLINGNSVCTDGDILVESGTENQVWVPLGLLRDHMLGIDVALEEGVNEESGKPFINITVSRIKEGKQFADISFKLKYNTVLSGLSNESLPDEPVTLPPDAPKYEFAADLSHYLQYMCPEDFDKHMILISPSNAVDETYIPEDLVSVPNPYYDNGSSLCRDASMSLEALFLEMYTLGFKDMKVHVAYRTYEQQKKQFDTYVYNERYYYRSHYESEGKWFSDTAYTVLGKTYLEEKYISQNKTSLSADDARRVAMSYSAYPGTSDHQSGLAFDLYLSGYSGKKFAESDEYKWLAENAHKFGFIFRYPEGKENVTGYSFEPYHLRFVGQYHAAIIYESGLSLDEYIDKYLN